MKMIRFIAIFAAFVSQTGAYAQGTPPGMPGSAIISNEARFLPAIAKNGMVASQEAKATRIGVEILERGGNAVDAAVATAFALAVTLPRAGNLAGGGFMLVHLAEKNQTIAIDYRETAPKAIKREMFLNEKGEPDPKKSRESGLSVGVPGTVHGLFLAHEKYGSGKLSWSDLIEPALRLARDGLIVKDDLADSLQIAAERLAAFPSTKAIFFNNNLPFATNELLVQKDLADTLELISRKGTDGFYKGVTADKLVQAIKQTGGIMSHDDLETYKPILREPVKGTYRGYDIASMPPPSSGGIHLIQILNILENYNIETLKAESADTLHVATEAMKLAYADRARWLGDPERTKVPLKGLISKTYAKNLKEKISKTTAKSASEIKAGNPLPHEPDQTTHFSIIDNQGNAVSNTYTLNFSYGLGLVAEGTGMILNNQIDDFAFKSGSINAYGLVSGEANMVAPSARPLSSMTPTIFFKNGKVFLITGSPGGSRIISTVLQTVINVIDFKMNIAEAVSAPRIHHQWQPDILLVEKGLSPDTLAILNKRGHKTTIGSTSGSANSILITNGTITGAADPRQRGTLALGY